MTPTLSVSFQLILNVCPPPTVVFVLGETSNTCGGRLSGGPLTTSNACALTDETGRFTPSSAVILILPKGVGTDGMRQSKLRALPSTAPMVLYAEPSVENSIRWL